MKSNRFMVLCGLAVMLAAWPGVAGANLITNGGFETGTIAPGTTDYMLWVDLLPAEVYVIGSTPGPLHPVISDFGPHSGRYMMMVNGAAEGHAGLAVWQDTVTGLTPGQKYEFSFWTKAWWNDVYAVLQTTINGDIVGADTVPLFPDPPTQEGSPWAQFSHTWVADGTTATIVMEDLTMAAGGNDFCLDDLAFSAVIPAPGAILLVGLGTGLVGMLRRRRAL